MKTIFSEIKLKLKRESNFFFCFFWLTVASIFLQGQTSKDNYKNIDFKTIDQSFTNPPNQYRLVLYYMNGNLNENVVPTLKAYGIGGIQTSVAYSNYLVSEEGWNQANSNINLAVNNGMRAWINDERGYPSSADGETIMLINK
jgi:hypothetical protein